MYVLVGRYYRFIDPSFLVGGLPSLGGKYRTACSSYVKQAGRQAGRQRSQNSAASVLGTQYTYVVHGRAHAQLKKSYLDSIPLLQYGSKLNNSQRRL